MSHGPEPDLHHLAPRRPGGRRSAGARARPLPQLADRGGAAGVSGDAGPLRQCGDTGARRARVRRAGGRGRPPAAPGGGAQALARVGYGFASEWAAAEILKRPITVIGDDPAVDVFTVAWKVKYEQAAPRAEVVDVEGVRIPLIALDDLIETKRTGRLQDAADIEVLEEIRRLRG